MASKNSRTYTAEEPLVGVSGADCTCTTQCDHVLRATVPGLCWQRTVPYLLVAESSSVPPRPRLERSNSIANDPVFVIVGGVRQPGAAQGAGGWPPLVLFMARSSKQNSAKGTGKRPTPRSRRVEIQRVSLVDGQLILNSPGAEGGRGSHLREDAYGEFVKAFGSYGVTLAAFATPLQTREDAFLVKQVSGGLRVEICLWTLPVHAISVGRVRFGYRRDQQKPPQADVPPLDEDDEDEPVDEDPDEEVDRTRMSNRRLATLVLLFDGGRLTKEERERLAATPDDPSFLDKLLKRFNCRRLVL